MTQTGIKLCPFCGSEADIFCQEHTKWGKQFMSAYIMCLNDECRGQAGCNFKGITGDPDKIMDKVVLKAVEAWNARFTPQ